MVDTSRAQQQQQQTPIPISSTILEQQQPLNSHHPQSSFFQHQTSPQPQPSPSGGYNHHRILTSSNSFDSKAQIPNFSTYHMSAEAAKLFATLQQSPLPLQTDVINYC